MPFPVEIPYGGYWSTPFAKWQGSLAHLHSIEFAAWVARGEIEKRQIDPRRIDHGILGSTIIQHHSFYGFPWLAGMAGLGHVTGPSISQACATGVRMLLTGAQDIAMGLGTTSLLVAADRTSNGPHVYYPAPTGPGGTGTHEDCVLDSFNCDPLGMHSMLQTAENVARKRAISTEQQHEVVIRRLEQYRNATSNDYAFQRRYMSLPFNVPRRDLGRIRGSLTSDEGIYESTAVGLSGLKPVIENGTVTVGSQTHPADGNAALFLATPQSAQELSRDASIRIELAGFGYARADLAFMPEAPVTAARAAMAQANVSANDLKALKSHNPFAVNDIVISRELGFPLEQMNNFGCSLIWGHPQGPTALRSIIELIEELVLEGGGYGLFTGCAAGDSAIAVVLRVSQR